MLAVKGKKKKKKGKRRTSVKKGEPKFATAKSNVFSKKHLEPVGNYTFLDVLGKGGFGTVYRAIDTHTGRSVAIKRINLAGVKKKDRDALQKEIRLLQRLQHANITAYIDSIPTPYYLNIVLELAESGSISSLLNKVDDTPPEHLVALYVAQVLLGLQYLHQQGVVHRDIKGANILVTKDGMVKLADFGVATSLSENGAKHHSMVGTPYWMAPELIEMRAEGTACDIWSVGATVIEFMTGEPPYFGINPMAALYHIVQDDHPPLPSGISPELTDFLMECFQKDPTLRIDATGLLKHQWLKGLLGRQWQNNATKKDNMRKSMIDTTLAYGEGGSKRASALSARNQNDHRVRTRKGSFFKEKLLTIDMDMRRHQAQLVKFQEDDKEDEGYMDLDESALAKPPKKKSALLPAAITTVDLGKLADSNADDGNMQDLDGLDEMDLVAKLEDKVMGQEWEEDEDDDPFDSMEFDVDEVDAALQQALYAFERLVDTLSPKAEVKNLLNICGQMKTILEDNTVVVRLRMFKTGVLPLVELLEVSDADVLEMVFKVINTALALTHAGAGGVGGSPIPATEAEVEEETTLLKDIYARLALNGVIPVVIRKSGNPDYPEALRQEAAQLCARMCLTATNQFIACGGLRVLVTYLTRQRSVSGSTSVNRFFVHTGIVCLHHIFTVTNHAKNDFCRILCTMGVLPLLVNCLSYVSRDKESETDICSFVGKRDINQDFQPASFLTSRFTTHEVVHKVGDLLELFVRADGTVKAHFATNGLMATLVDSIKALPHSTLKVVVKSVCQLFSDSSTLTLLESVGVLPPETMALAVSLLLSDEDKHGEDAIDTETRVDADIKIQCLKWVFHLCKVQVMRRPQVARIFPHLKDVIATNHGLKEFAYPILFKIATSSRENRTELRKQNGLEMFMQLLAHPSSSAYALDALYLWLKDGLKFPDVAPPSGRLTVEQVLCLPESVDRLTVLFNKTNGTLQFEKILNKFHRILSSSALLCDRLGQRDSFTQHLSTRLARPANSNNVRIHLLKILALLLERSSSPLAFSLQTGVADLVKPLQTATSVIVQQLAENITEMCNVLVTQGDAGFGRRVTLSKGVPEEPPAVLRAATLPVFPTEDHVTTATSPPRTRTKSPLTILPSRPTPPPFGDASHNPNTPVQPLSPRLPGLTPMPTTPLFANQRDRKQGLPQDKDEGKGSGGQEGRGSGDEGDYGGDFDLSNRHLPGFSNYTMGRGDSFAGASINSSNNSSHTSSLTSSMNSSNTSSLANSSSSSNNARTPSSCEPPSPLTTLASSPLSSHLVSSSPASSQPTTPKSSSSIDSSPLRSPPSPSSSSSPPSSSSSSSAPSSSSSSSSSSAHSHKTKRQCPPLGSVYTQKQLRSMGADKYANVIDLRNKEYHLSDADFEELFGMTKQTWGTLPKWRRVVRKREHGLF